MHFCCFVCDLIDNNFQVMILVVIVVVEVAVGKTEIPEMEIIMGKLS